MCQKIMGTIRAADSLIDSVLSHPRADDVNLQSPWDNVNCRVQAGELKPIFNQHRLTCFNAANMPRSGGLHNAVPSAAVGILLDGDACRIARSHRLGFRTCRPHKCLCGASIVECNETSWHIKITPSIHTYISYSQCWSAYQTFSHKRHH